MASKTFVATQVSRVIEDKHLPDAVRTGLTAALLQGSDLVETVLDEMLGGIGVKAERLYEFAKAGHYVHGLPSGSFSLPGDGLLAAVKATLESIHGVPVVMEYAHFGPPNALHLAWGKLIAEHGYNPATNQLAILTAQVGVPVYLEDIEVVVNPTNLEKVDPRTLYQWGISPKAGYTPLRNRVTPETSNLVGHSPVKVDIMLPDMVQATAMYQGGDSLNYRQTIDISVTEYSATEYFQAAYTLNGVRKFWTYAQGTGTYPELEAVFDPEEGTNGQFFPFIYFRYGKVSEVEDKSTESYKDGRKLAEYLGLPFDQVSSNIDANPDIDDIEQAMLMFGVPANTENRHEQRYLYEFFSNLYLSQPSDLRFQSEAQADIVSSQLFGADIHPPGIIVKDARFKMSVSNQGIYRIKKAGSVAEVGGYSSGTATFNKQMRVWNQQIEAMEDIQVPISYHYFRKQLTAGLYEELQVVELQTRFHIFGEYFTTGDDEDKILLIPVDHSITGKYSLGEREDLYARSLHYVFNSRVVVKVKWYQTDAFQAFITIVGFIITAFSMGTDGGSALAAALATGAYATAAMIVLEMIINVVIAKVLFKLFAKALGAEVALAIAIIAAMVGFGLAAESGSIAGAPWAKELLALSNGLTDGTSAYLKDSIADLVGEQKSWDTYVEEQLASLEKTKELLEQDSFLSPFVIFGEKPEEYYNRTVHSGNIGTVGIQAISSFVEARLSLPSLEETLNSEFGEKNYV